MSQSDLQGEQKSLGKEKSRRELATGRFKKTFQLGSVGSALKKKPIE